MAQWGFTHFVLSMSPGAQQNKSQHLNTSASKRQCWAIWGLILLFCALTSHCFCSSSFVYKHAEFLKFRKLETILDLIITLQVLTIFKFTCFFPHHLESKNQHSLMASPHKRVPWDIHTLLKWRGAQSARSTLPPASGGPSLSFSIY